MRSRCLTLALGVCLLLPAALVKPSRGWKDATTRVTSAQGRFEIHGLAGEARHLHGGPPAQLGHARFVFLNRGDAPRRVSVVDIEFLQNVKDCENPPSKTVAHPKSGGILLEDGVQRESAAQVEVKANATVEATVGFAAVPAYYVYCDRFAFRVHFLIDGEKLAVIDEVTLTREEPLRPHRP